MSRYTRINLAELPPPPVVEPLDFETILAEMRADVVTRAPDLADVLTLESEPIVKLLETAAYRELLMRQRVNDAARAVMLAFATLGDLDQLAAIFGVERLEISPADPVAIPPVAAVYEADDDFRGRIQISLEAQSTAGPAGAYEFWTLTADADVKDAAISSPAPGEVLVTVLSRSGDGTPAQAVLDAVTATLTDEDVRPLTDQVTVQSATIVPFMIDATLYLFNGPDSAVVLSAANAALDTYLDDSRAIGRDVTVSGIHAALHQAGVQRVVLTSPAADIVIGADEAGWCSARQVVFGGRDE